MRNDYHVPQSDLGKGSAGAGGVDVLEQKEIDFYDITILKATDSTELMNWLNNNEYRVPENTKPLLDKYVSQGNIYFIANKIDLANKYEDEIEIVRSLQQDENIKGTYFSDYSFIDANYLIKEILEDVERNWSCTRYVPGFLTFYSHISRVYDLEGEFNQTIFLKHFYRDIYPLDEGFINEFLNENKKFLENGDYNTNPEKLGAHYWVETIYNPVYNKQIDEEPGIYCLVKRAYPEKGTPAEYSLIHYEANVTNYAINIGPCNGITEAQKNDLRENLKEFYEAYDKYNQTIVDEKYEKACAVLSNPGITEEEASEMFMETYHLKTGLATPLKFEFTPETPYYPLEISSINKGTTHIEVYLFTNSAEVKEKNGMLNLDQQINLTSELKTEFNKYIEIGNSEYISRFIYLGPLTNLTKDATFKACLEVPSITCPSGSELKEEKDSQGCVVRYRCSYQMTNGENMEVKITLDEASQIVQNQLQAGNCNAELKEEIIDGERRLVYEFSGEKEAKLFGLFRIRARIISLVDAQTGQVLDIEKPWWSFLASRI